MLKYIGKKVLIAIATVFVLATATFFLMKLIPGDPFLNDKIPVAVQDKQRAFYGLDKPVPQQYLTYEQFAAWRSWLFHQKDRKNSSGYH